MSKRHSSTVSDTDPSIGSQTSSRNADRFALLLVFFLSSFVLSGLMIHSISDVAKFETGDAAANSLLVREAKDFRLTVGNYSRVGFNHPGPALLYVLAAGEIVFHDVFPLARTPFGGQMVGLGVWNSLLLALIFHQMLRASSGRLAGMALFSIFLALLAKLEPGSFTNSWFPYVYVLPFALFLCSLALALARRDRGTVVLGFATGILWNAHVAFIPITLIAIALGLFVITGRLVRRQQLKASWVDLLRSFVPAVVVWAILQVPLLIELSRRWPSPVKDFVAFGSDTPDNPLVDALRFTLSFWPLTRGLVGALWIAALLVLLYRGRKDYSIVSALITTALISTVAALVYAVFGIDDLNFRYVALFYRSAIALGLAGSAVVLGGFANRMLTAPRRREVAIRGVSFAALVFAVFAIVRHPIAVSATKPRLDEDVVRMAEATGKTGARLHIDIAQFGFLWPRLAGLQLAASRQGAPRTCIASRWHILFTAKAKCAESDRALPDVRVEAALDASGNPTGINFVPIDLRLKTGDYFVPGAPADNDIALVLGNGWSAIEAGRIWAAADTSSLDFTTASAVTAKVELDLEALIGGAQREVRAEVRVNGVITDTWVFTPSNNRGVRTVNLPATTTGRSMLELRVNNRSSAVRLGLGPDRRKVGLALFKVDVRSVSALP